ncbi:MAG TPA: riboflavin synthase, partial [Acidimicrobiaceae bacterium]|nr:riboflavin synthase [Acidimicrobiaceae bacterium]
MFTGIVEELGTVATRDGSRLRINCSNVLDGASIGDSTAVNGCCLTIVAFDAAAGWWEADVSDETFNRTNLGALSA